MVAALLLSAPPPFKPLSCTLTSPQMQLPEAIEMESLQAKLPKVHPTALDFIFQCLQYAPDDRPSCEDLMHHKYFKGFAETFEVVRVYDLRPF